MYYVYSSSVDNGSGLMNKSSTHMFEAMAMEIEQLLAQVSTVAPGTVFCNRFALH